MLELNNFKGVPKIDSLHSCPSLFMREPIHAESGAVRELQAEQHTMEKEREPRRTHTSSSRLRVHPERIEAIWPRGGWIGLHTNLNFFCRKTVRLRNLREYSRNLRTRQPPRINSELPGAVRTEQIWNKLRITWWKPDLPNSRRYLWPSKKISKQRTS
jgi:hypothetical protein